LWDESYSEEEKTAINCDAVILQKSKNTPVLAFRSNKKQLFTSAEKLPVFT